MLVLGWTANSGIRGSNPKWNVISSVESSPHARLEVSNADWRIPEREDLDPSLALVFFSNNNNFPEKKTFSCSAPHSSYFAEWEREWERRGPVGYIVSPLSLSCAPIRSRRRPTVLAPATTRRLLGSIGMPTALLLAMASPPISLRRLVVVCSGQILAWIIWSADKFR
jgi:hypothetical protein